MNKTVKIGLIVCAFIVQTHFAFAQTSNLEIDISNKIAKIQPTMYGVFFEDINFAADGGLYAEMIKNRSFEFELPMMAWIEPNSDRHSFNSNSGIAVPMKYGKTSGNMSFCRITLNDANGYEMINEGFRGMGIVKEAKYNLTLSAAKYFGEVTKIKFQFIDKDKNVLGETSISLDSKNWKNYSTVIVADKTEAKAQLKITFEGKGIVDLDMISLFPQETWMNRKNGMRKDIVQLLYDMKPGFLRFPGGCIVEGRTLAQRYQWKKTVGELEGRESLINRWNTEFAHKLTPDYFQSFGLGFYEYFQLSEDLGAEPLPILSCGMACQFNTGELVPMNELDPYVQDALDLIEFANGDANSTWGQLRVEMGHAEPFNLKYIGVGNEQWGTAYIERYIVFAKAIKEKYPNITIVSGSGPFPEGDFFEYGWEELKKLNAEIVDEHYYKSPQWFKDNATRYDKYDRNGPKIFAGEYAAQSIAIASADNKNNWDCALSEAAFMTGLERNAEVVHLTSYAPLMAHAEAWQWTPDMIWFNNLESYGTPNYYVQKLYSTNKGTDLISITESGKVLTGQNDLFASAVFDSTSKEVIVKIINTSAKVQTINLNFKAGKLNSMGTIITLKGENLSDENSFNNPKKISPSEFVISQKNNKLATEIAPYSFNVIKFKLK